MTRRAPLLQLTWAGLDAAVDVIAAQCCWRDRAGIHGADAGGHVLALALAERLGLNVLQQAGPGVVVIYGLAQQLPGGDDDVWAWVDLTPEQQLQSVMKVTPGTLVLMPWQDATAACARPFVAGFDD